MRDEKNLRTFLVGTPRPHRIVVRCPDDQTHELAPAATGRTWASIAATIVSLDPLAVELYDDGGKLLRATKWGQEEQRKETFAEGLGVPGADNETARLTHFANLLYKATEFSTKLAFEKMVEVFERVNERSAAIEARLERVETQYQRAMKAQIEAAYEQASDMVAAAAEGVGENGEGGSLADQLVASFFAGAAQAQAQRMNNPAAHAAAAAATAKAKATKNGKG